MKHTPGPWTLKYLDVYAGNAHVATATRQVADGDTQAAANARLIAAAPDLLLALQCLTNTARTFRNVPKDEQEWTIIDDEVLDAAFAAIRKATGD